MFDDLRRLQPAVLGHGRSQQEALAAGLNAGGGAGLHLGLCVAVTEPPGHLEGEPAAGALRFWALPPAVKQTA